MILVDILLAISLAVLFTGIVTASSVGARQIFDRAHDRDELLDAFDVSTSTTSSSRPFGNDRIETDMAVIASSSGDLSADSLLFAQIDARDPDHIADSAGTPLCSVDFSNHDTVGSYPSLHSNVVSIVQIALPTNPLIPLTDLEVRDGIAYISAHSTTASDPDVFVIDFNDRKNPKVLSSINTGPGITAIALAGNRIYAAAASTAAQLHVIRMDSLNSIVLEKKYKLPPPYATATEPVASSIFFDGNRVYLGTEKWDGDEFSIIDVSNPVQPVKIAGLDTGSKINNIFVRDGTAYIADSDQYQMRIVDISQPSTPQVVSSFSPSGWSRQEGKALSYFEDALGFARTAGGYDITTDHEAFAWATTSSAAGFPPFIFSSDPSAYHSVNIPSGVYGMLADRSHIYLATRQVNKEFQMFDRSLSTTTAISYPLPVAPQTLTCDGDHLYILAATAPFIYEISFD